MWKKLPDENRTAVHISAWEIGEAKLDHVVSIAQEPNWGVSPQYKPFTPAFLQLNNRGARWRATVYQN